MNRLGDALLSILGFVVFFFLIRGMERRRKRERRPRCCQCTYEVGDSACPVHGDQYDR